MSQFYVGPTDGNLPPDVPTSFVTENGTAVPAAHVLNVLANDNTDNNIQGISTSGSGNTVTVSLTNRFHGSVSTPDDTQTVLMSFPFTLPGTYLVDVSIAVFCDSLQASATFSMFGGFRVDALLDGQTIGTPDIIINKNIPLNNISVAYSFVTSPFQVKVTGLPGTSINWYGLGTYLQVV